MPADPLPPLPGEWRPVIDGVIAPLPDGAAVLVVAATDRGKTTFVAQAARALSAHGDRTAVVDADIGQSEIGPPGTVGVAWADPASAKMHDLKPAAQFFVGAFGASALPLEHAVATARAVQFARDAGARRILIDTTGFVSGPTAHRLKIAKAMLCRPAVVVAFEREGDGIDNLVRALCAASGARRHLLPAPEAVGRKSASLRATRRLSRLSQALTGAREFPLALGSLAILGATLGTGDPVPADQARWAGTALALPVVYTEKADGVLTLYVNGPAPRAGWESGAGPITDHFKARAVRALSLPAHHDILLGLHDGAGKLLAVGRFVRLDLERAYLIVSARLPESAAERVRLVAFGRVRVAADGSPGPEVRPGEI